MRPALITLVKLRVSVMHSAEAAFALTSVRNQTEVEATSMSFSFRKSFRLGPARINLSKSGLGISTNTTGATVGVGTRGSYGFKGLSFRKRISGPSANSGTSPNLSTGEAIVVGFALLGAGVVVVAAVAVLVWLIT
jgi:hypothetical protein